MTCSLKMYIDEITQKININPSADLHFEKANIYFNNGLYDSAVNECVEGLNLEPKHPNCFFMRINALVENKFLDDALAECECEIELNAKYAPAYLGRMAVYYANYCKKKSKEMLSEVFMDAIKAIDLKPDWAIPYNILGVIHSNENSLDEARKYYLKAIETAVKNNIYFSNPHFNLGNLYCKKKQYDYAITDLEKAIELCPAIPQQYNSLGIAYSANGRYDDAISVYSKAIELNPNNAVLYNSRAIAYHKSGDLRMAEAGYYESITQDDTYGSPHYRLGNLYFEQGRYEDSREKYEKAISYYEKKKNKHFLELINGRLCDIASLLASKDIKKDTARKIIDSTEAIHNEIEKRKKKMSEFLNSKYPVDNIDGVKFTVLRKWNSFTPIICASKGGGYFIQVGDKKQTEGKGIVVDPGFNFIENYIAKGFKFKQITDVFITHAHNDHTADLDSLLTLLHRYNKELKGGDLSDPVARFDDEDSIIYEVLNDFKYSVSEIRNCSEKMKEVNQRVEELFEQKAKKIIFYMTTGTFKKYSGFFDLMEKSKYKVVCVDAGCANRFSVGDMKVRVVKAKHNDILSDMASVGFCFEYNDFILIYTGDTGFWGMDNTYQELAAKYEKKQIYLVANLGGFEMLEKAYRRDEHSERCYYKNHLGRLGIAKIVEILEPVVCIVSEFGEEFDGNRINITNECNRAFKEAHDNEEIPHQITFLPADIGLSINSKGQVKAITSFDENNSPIYDYIDPDKVDAGGDCIERNDNIYYYDKSKFSKQSIEEML